jgi:hypothetical protein
MIGSMYGTKICLKEVLILLINTPNRHSQRRWSDGQSGKNRFSPEKHWFPPDWMSGIVPMLRMLKPFPMLGLKFMAGAIPGKRFCDKSFQT